MNELLMIVKCKKKKKVFIKLLIEHFFNWLTQSILYLKNDLLEFRVMNVCSLPKKKKKNVYSQLFERKSNIYLEPLGKVYTSISFACTVTFKLSTNRILLGT